VKGTLGGSIVVGKRVLYVFCCHDLYIECRNDETKQKSITSEFVVISHSQADHGPDARKSAETHRRPILPRHALTVGYSPEVDQLREDDQAGGAADPQTPGALVQALHPMAEPSIRRCGQNWRRTQSRWKIAELFADERCSEAILEFLRITDVGRKIPVEKAETESTESGRQECPRGECICGLCGW